MTNATPKYIEVYSHTLDLMANEVFQNNVNHGFWEGKVEDYNKGEKLMLIVSELAEALEAIRAHDSPDDKLSQYPGEHVEIADAIIRLLDYCAAYKIPIGEVLLAKHNYNVGRPYKHGKKF